MKNGVKIRLFAEHVHYTLTCSLHKGRLQKLIIAEVRLNYNYAIIMLYKCKL